MDEIIPNMIYTFYNIHIWFYGRDDNVGNDNNQTP